MLAFLAVPVWAQDISVADLACDVALEGERITVGDPVAVRISAELPDGFLFDDVHPLETGFLRYRDTAVESGDALGDTTLSVVVNFVGFRPGVHRIEGFVLSLLGPDGVVRERALSGLDVEVAALPAAEVDPELRAEAAGIAVRYRDYTLAWVLGIAILAVLMGLSGFVIARNRPKIVVEPPPPPPRPPEEIALEKLDAIRRDRLIERGEFMDFYVRLSEAAREYLGGRYGFDGLDMTTSEILDQLRDEQMKGVVGEQIADLLYHSDLVKFAKLAPREDDQTDALDTTYGLVKTTTPERQEPEPEPEPEPESEVTP